MTGPVADAGPDAAHPLDTARQRSVFLSPTEVHPAQQPDGGGRFSPASGWCRIGVAVKRTRLGGDGVEEFGRALNRQRLDGQAAHMPAFQSHHLPSDNRRIAALLGLVSPSTTGWILGVLNEPNGLLSCQRQVLVLGHCIGFGQTDSGQSMRIHTALRIVKGDTVGRSLSVVDQIFQAF